ncbi:hypothetical protein ElyMa_004821500 [Elysia marginata]|uniref:Uncharacterized protein n=1 Tax=Elysia marginata TaxID=1093978 RepID=A0AAV4IMG9_9GAST|nr:hypothetical protein ElyMa_004821500 [Elysia marginata]
MESDLGLFRKRSSFSCKNGSKTYKIKHIDIPKGIFPAQYMATSKLIQRFDSLFNVFNVNGGSSKALFKHPITTTSSSVTFLIESKTWLKALHYDTDDSRKPAEPALH